MSEKSKHQGPPAFRPGVPDVIDIIIMQKRRVPGWQILTGTGTEAGEVLPSKKMQQGLSWTGKVRRSPPGQKDGPTGFIVPKLVKHQRAVIPHEAGHAVSQEGAALPIQGHIVGGEQLVQLHDHFGDKTGVSA